MSRPGESWPRDLLGERAHRSSDRTGLIDVDTDRSWTYGELDVIVDGIATSLTKIGVEPGDTVATVLDSRPMAVGFLFATIRAAATLAPLNVELDQGTQADQIDQLDPTLVCCEDATEAAAVSCFDGRVSSLDEPSRDGVDRFGIQSFSTRNTDADSAGDSPGLDADDVALVVFTSGTTGPPKGVRLTPSNLYSSAAASATRLGVTPRDGWLSPLSTYHVGGMAPFVRTTLYGTTGVLQRGFDPERTAAALGRSDVSCVSLVPTMLARLMDHGWRPDEDLRFVLLGGGPIPESLLDRCREQSVPVCPTYGASETASQVATATPRTALEAPGTVGRELSGVTVSILNGDVSCEPGETGQLVVEGPMVSPGYLDEHAGSTALSGGRFETGDLGYRDADGRLWVVGRADDVIVTGGENVRPTAVEAALTRHSEVFEAAVVGVPDQEWGERVVALVVPGETEPSADDVRSSLRGTVPEYALPKSIRFTDSLPRTPSGTVDRASVREYFE